MRCLQQFMFPWLSQSTGPVLHHLLCWSRYKQQAMKSFLFQEISIPQHISDVWLSLVVRNDSSFLWWALPGWIAELCSLFQFRLLVRYLQWRSVLQVFIGSISWKLHRPFYLCFWEQGSGGVSGALFIATPTEGGSFVLIKPSSVLLDT